MTETRIYIGADNHTMVTPWRTIVAWADHVLRDYTYQTAWGVYDNDAENCVILIHIGKPISETHLLELKDATNQDCILVTETQVKVREI